MIPRLFVCLKLISCTLISLRSRLISAVVVAAALLVSAQAQNEDVIRFNTDLVTVNVAVKDGKGRSLLGLKPQDFLITDENNPVIPEFFESEGPASIIFVVDTSSSMSGSKWKSLIAGLKDALKNASDGNDYTLIAFSDSPQLLAKSVSAAQLLTLLLELKPNGNTALYDGMVLGFDVLKQVPQRHRALVLISDGEDSVSRLSLAEVEKEASGCRSTIYSIGILLKDYCNHSKQKTCVGRDTISQLAKVTGGLAYFPKPEQLSPVLKEISSDVRGQYSFSYYPPDKRPGWREVRVAIGPTERRPNLRYQQRYLMR